MVKDESRMKEIKRKNVVFMEFTQMQAQIQKHMEQMMNISVAQEKNKFKWVSSSLLLYFI